jgi:hypothetical protein
MKDRRTRKSSKKHSKGGGLFFNTPKTIKEAKEIAKINQNNKFNENRLVIETKKLEDANSVLKNQEEIVKNIEKAREDLVEQIKKGNEKIIEKTETIKEENIVPAKASTPKKTYLQATTEYVTAPINTVTNTVYNTGKSVYDLLGYYAFGN